jgi:DNA-binding NtrC family response regulator
MMLKYIFVDDDVIFLQMLQVFFGQNVHQYASDARQVAKILRAHGPFDVMISDYDMPYQDGMILAQWAHELYPHMTIAMLSGHTKPDLLPYYIGGWILKPVDLDVLNWEIQDMVSGQQSSKHSDVFDSDWPSKETF